MKKWSFVKVLLILLTMSFFSMQAVFAEEERTMDTEPFITEKQNRTVSLGSSQITGNYAKGAYNQGIVTMTYSYQPLLSVEIADKPIIVLKLPTEISSQLANNPTKQQDFISLLTGSVTFPSGILGNQTYSLKDTTRGFTVSYSEEYGSIYVTFPLSTGILLLTNKWEVSITFDVGAIYKKGITIPPASNGVSYAIRGTFSDFGTGLILINIITNNTKAGTINIGSMSIGTYPAPQVSPPVISSLKHLQTTVSGTIQQTQDATYNYTVQLSINRTDGTSTPIVVNNIPVDSSGNFSTTLSAALEYGDNITGIVIAKSKTTTDYVQSLVSNAVPVTWSVNPVTSAVVAVGSTQITGTAVQTNAGSYQVKAQINGGATYTTTLSSDGTFSFTGLPSIQGGDQVVLTVQGLSSRNGSILTASSPYTQKAAYVTPKINVVQTIERKNAQGDWETASSVVSGQMVRYTLTATLNNSFATWKNQTLKAYIPKGLTQLSTVSLVKKTNTNTSTPIIGTQLLTDPSTTNQYWYFKNSLSINDFSEINTSFILQYTGVTTTDMIGTNIVFSSAIDGTDGGGTAFATLTASNTIPVQNGTLQFIQAPTQISFRNISIPSKSTVYTPNTVTSSLRVTDGRVVKSQWHLLVRESQAMQSTTTSKTISQAFIYRKNGQEYPISTIASEVYAYTASDNNSVEIPWNQQNGIFLKISPNANINVNEAYTAQLQWILSDSPL